MRRPNRNIEIFSMSVLDMFASALGAFIMITIILYPSYNKKMQLEARLATAQAAVTRLQAEVQQQRRQLQSLQTQLAAAQQEAERQRQAAAAAITRAEHAEQDAQEARTESAQMRMQIETLRSQLAKTFLIVTAEWLAPGHNDIDLHVTDPDGHEFSFEHNNRTHQDYPDTDGQLSNDAQSGPGLELFQLPVAKPGIYKVELVFYTKENTDQVVVKTKVFARRGRSNLPDATLNYDDSKPKFLVRNIVVKPDGTVDTGSVDPDE